MTEPATDDFSANAEAAPGDFANLQATGVARMAEKIFGATQPGVVFGQPIVSGAVTVITASEVSSGGGFGAGSGFGRAQGQPADAESTPPGGATSNAPVAGGGRGMGGGGGAMARPVAAIVIGPDGVQIMPIYDVTKVALAGLAALGTIVAIKYRSRRAR